jgi:hypothetical protein
MACCVLVIVLPVSWLVAAAILSFAVRLTNRVAKSHRPSAVAITDYDDEFEAEEAPRRKAVPSPGLGRAMVIELLTAVVAIAAGIVGTTLVTNAIEPPEGLVIAAVVGVALVFLTHAGLVAAILSVSFSRACLVTLFQLLIGLGAGALVAGLIFAAGAGIALFAG